MRLYVTTKNSGPSYGRDPLTMLYLGPDLEKAQETIGIFAQYERTPEQFPTQYVGLYSAIPDKMDREMIAFYSADGWWMSIVAIDFEVKK